MTGYLQLSHKEVVDAILYYLEHEKKVEGRMVTLREAPWKENSEPSGLTVLAEVNFGEEG